MNPDTPCPCGSGRPLAACCGPYLAGAALPPDAEALMRSRYSAYVLGDEAYLLTTWHPDTRPPSLDLDQGPATKWLGLAVKRHEDDGDGRATVEFVARYKIGGRAHRLHETSRFLREGGRWLYLGGNSA
ncbi:MAG: YchJ family metal-binding protein [Pseudomonadota bacterium]|nr:YchJ family metal-binding protein [Pseudomonadota bacterium]MDP1904368.1 YchJ family metal-binding protein [Pseudomonadota bacterium]MDP2353521.1 YchJ family metal-binding protein [Pseudomonadota bacterium]